MPYKSLLLGEHVGLLPLLLSTCLPAIGLDTASTGGHNLLLVVVVSINQSFNFIDI